MSDSNKPDPLSALLAAWRVKPSPSADFRAQVWQRIGDEAAAERSFGLWLRQHAAGFGAVAAAVMLVSGLGGVWTAQRFNRAEQEARFDAYVMSIDPHQRVEATEAPR